MSMSVREAANDGAASVLKEELYQQRMSERELARRMEVPQSWLNKRLTGEIPLRFGEVFEIASLLRIPLDRFSAAVANVTSEMRAASERLCLHSYRLTCGFLPFLARDGLFALTPGLDRALAIP